MNLFEKIQAVANKVMTIEKDMHVGNGSYGYKAVSDLSVTKAVKDAEREFKLVSIPVRQELIHQEIVRVQDKDKEKITYSFIVKMTTRIVDTEKPEDFIEVESFGHGLDSGDKGFGKASTYARKYSLLNSYKVATGEDPDSSPSEQQRSLSHDEVKEKVVGYLMKNNDYLISILGHFNIGSVEDLTGANIKVIYSNLKKKNLL